MAGADGQRQSGVAGALTEQINAAACPSDIPEAHTPDSTQSLRRPSRRFVLIEYVLLRGVNDTPQDAERSAHTTKLPFKMLTTVSQPASSPQRRNVPACRLLKLLVGIEAKVNLITFNAHSGTHFKPSETAATMEFRSRLIAGGRVCTVRESRGDDEMAACGQLGNLGGGFGNLAPVLQPPPHFLELMSVA